MKALVVFSGGQDSTTCLLFALKHYPVVEVITFLYGQRHKIEIEQAKKICEILKVKQHVVDASAIAAVAQSALLQPGEIADAHPVSDGLPASFVPNRNVIFISLAHSLAQKIGAEVIITGVSQTDYSGYPDCREYVTKFIEHTLNLASETFIDILTPLMHKTKAETFALASQFGGLELVLEESHTCYEGDRSHRFAWGYGCGHCPACKLRAKGWEEWGETIRAEHANLPVK